VDELLGSSDQIDQVQFVHGRFEIAGRNPYDALLVDHGDRVYRDCIRGVIGHAPSH
jgi:hypothetical protein